jgi:putative peptidoglycan lipid II flippase
LLVFSALMIALMPWAIWLIDDFGAGGRTNADFDIAGPDYLSLSGIDQRDDAVCSDPEFDQQICRRCLCPVLLNLCMITAMLDRIAGRWWQGNPEPRRDCMLLAWSVSFAGVLQMLWLWYWARRAGFRFGCTARALP